MGKVMLLLALFSSGCSVNYSGEGRGFIYEGLGVKFTCSHTPSKTEVQIDKEVAALLGLAILLNDTKPSDEKKEAIQDLSSALLSPPSSEKLVKLCKQLIDGEPIKSD